MARRVVLALVVVLGLVVGAFAGGGARPTGSAGPPLYPDLLTQAPSGLYFDSAYLADGRLHRLLRFSNTVWNAGEGRLEIQGDPNPSGSSDVYQNLYDGTSGGTQVGHRYVTADLYYHPSHYHYHFEGFAIYHLEKRDPTTGSYRDTGVRSSKTSFCIIDFGRVTGAGPTWAQYTTCSGSLQGLSVGWGDTYDASLPDQWIDLGLNPLADGDYAINSIADPYNKLDEAGRDGNNAARIYFSVRGGGITNLRTTPLPPPTQPPPPPPACGTPGAGQVVLYEHVDYLGRCETFSIDDGDLRDNAIGNDQASSLKVGPGTTVSLCVHILHEGGCEAFTASDANLVANPIGNDNASSLRFGSTAVAAQAAAEPLPSVGPSPSPSPGPSPSAEPAASAAPSAVPAASVAPSAAPVAPVVGEVAVRESRGGIALIEVAATEAEAVRLEYGLDETYGLVAEAVAAPVADTGTSWFLLRELAPGTTYHYRVVASGPGGETRTADAVFATPGLEGVPVASSAWADAGAAVAAVPEGAVASPSPAP